MKARVPKIVMVVTTLMVAGPIPSASAAERPSTLSVIFENDLFYHADRDYTNGVEVSWCPSDKAAAQRGGFAHDLLANHGRESDSRVRADGLRPDSSTAPLSNVLEVGQFTDRASSKNSVPDDSRSAVCRKVDLALDRSARGPGTDFSHDLGSVQSRLNVSYLMDPWPARWIQVSDISLNQSLSRRSDVR